MFAEAYGRVVRADEAHRHLSGARWPVRRRRPGPSPRAGRSRRRSAHSAFHGRGMSAPAAWVQRFVAPPLEMAEAAMRGRNQPPTEPTKSAVEFWDQIRAGRDIEEAAKAL